jgi:hypothetical protein
LGRSDDAQRAATGYSARRHPGREARTIIKELDTVILTRDLPQHGLKRGDIGAVVMVHGAGEAFDVEFVSMDGQTIALETLQPADIRRGEREVLHARTLAPPPG